MAMCSCMCVCECISLMKDITQVKDVYLILFQIMGGDDCLAVLIDTVNLLPGASGCITATLANTSAVFGIPNKTLTPKEGCCERNTLCFL